MCVYNCRVGGGGGGGGFGLCRPRVISRDQASLMSAGSSRGTQASHTALPTPSSPSLGIFWLHTAPCWKSCPQHHPSLTIFHLYISTCIFVLYCTIWSLVFFYCLYTEHLLIQCSSSLSSPLFIRLLSEAKSLRKTWRGLFQEWVETSPARTSLPPGTL